MVESHGEISADGTLVHLLAAAGEHDFATLHDEKTGREAAGKVEILLDQEDRHITALGESADDALDLLDDRGLDAFSWLVEDQQSWARDEGPGDCQLLLLTSGKIAAAAMQHVLQ